MAGLRPRHDSIPQTGRTIVAARETVKTARTSGTAEAVQIANFAACNGDGGGTVMAVAHHADRSLDTFSGGSVE